VVLLCLLFTPVAVLWAFSGAVLLALGEPPRLCNDVQAIMRILIFGAPGYIAFESLKKYLQCQGIKAGDNENPPCLKIAFRHHASTYFRFDGGLPDQPCIEYLLRSLYNSGNAWLSSRIIHHLLVILHIFDDGYVSVTYTQVQRDLGRSPTSSCAEP